MRPSSVPPCVRSGHCNSSSMYRLVETFSFHFIEYIVLYKVNRYQIYCIFCPGAENKFILENWNQNLINDSSAICFLNCFFLNNFWNSTTTKEIFSLAELGSTHTYRNDKIESLENSKKYSLVGWILQSIIKRGEINIFWWYFFLWKLKKKIKVVYYYFYGY